MRPPIEAKKPRKKSQRPIERLTPEQVAHEIKLIEMRLGIGHKFVDNGEQVYVTLLTLSEAFARIAILEAERTSLPDVVAVAGEMQREICAGQLQVCFPTKPDAIRNAPAPDLESVMARVEKKREGRNDKTTS